MRDQKLLIGIVVGLLVGAGAVFLLGTGSDDGDAVDTAPLELPDQVGSLLRLSDAVEERDGTDNGGDELVARTERAEQRGTDIVSEAHDGAAATVRDYTDSELQTFVTVVAVRAPSSPLIAYEFVEPADIGLEALLEEVVEVGAVECLVRNEFAFTGDETDEPARPTFCQRHDDDLSVRIKFRGDIELVEAARMVDESWDHLTAGV